VAEAIASGLKVVLYDIGTYKIFEKNVIVVEKANIGKMAKIIIELIGKQNSNDTRERKLGRVSSVLDWQEVAKREIQSISDR
jgi:glycosyltransferase involved in cell wall biosynthesis